MAVISTMIVMTTLTKSSPAIRCGEPEDIMNGILERKCQVFITITNTIIITIMAIIIQRSMPPRMLHRLAHR